MSLHAVEVTEDFKLLTPTWFIDLLGGVESLHEIMKSLILEKSLRESSPFRIEYCSRHVVPSALDVKFRT